MRLRFNVSVVCTILWFGVVFADAEPLALDRAIRLTLAHSTTSAISSADVQKAFASYREVRNSYVPQVTAGSGLGWTYGYPLTIQGSPPALFNVVAQSSFINLSQNRFIKAAKIEWHASELKDKDQRNATIQDVILTFAELAKWEARFSRLQEDEAEAHKLEQAVTQRLQEGIDNAMDLNKAKLIAARARLHRIEASGSADVLRQHLSTLTGLAVSSIEIALDTMPALPALPENEDLSKRAVANSPAVKLAEQHSIAEVMRASGERRALYPSIDFSAQYARFTTFNNYQTFFPPGTFQPDNATIGLGLRIPLFNASQRARAQGAEADALKAKKQAEATRSQVSEETLKLQRAVEQLAAAREVARLEYELAKAGVDAAQTRLDAGTGPLRDVVDARSQSSERYLLFQDADFEYQRGRIGLLRATGELEQWALQSPSN